MLPSLYVIEVIREGDLMGAALAAVGTALAAVGAAFASLFGDATTAEGCETIGACEISNSRTTEGICRYVLP